MTERNLSLGRAASAVEGDLRLPKPPGVIRRFWARHPWLTDSLIAALYAIPILLGAFTVMAVDPAVEAVPAIAVSAPVVAGVSIVSVLFRRRIPLIALAVSIGCAALTVTSLNGILSLGVCFTLYSVAVYHSNRAAWIGLASTIVALVVGGSLPLPHAAAINGTHPAIAYGVFLLLAVLIGVNVGNRKRYLEALTDRAAQLARERDQQAQLATAAERARIAREMHDIISHSLTVMVSLADGSAALTSSAPERSADAMRQVAETGRHALTDMRRMLGVLNEAEIAIAAPEADMQPQPGASDVSLLIDRFRAAGLPVRYSVTGSPPDDPGLQLTVYRVVQESLTNVLRHAADALAVEAVVEYRTESVRVQVDDNGTGRLPATAGTGRGLVGMRERVALYGGTLESAAKPEGGWRVVATLQTHGSSENNDR
jgi:signal transduction histidine kinase